MPEDFDLSSVKPTVEPEELAVSEPEAFDLSSVAPAIEGDVVEAPKLDMRINRSDVDEQSVATALRARQKPDEALLATGSFAKSMSLLKGYQGGAISQAEKIANDTGAPMLHVLENLDEYKNDLELKKQVSAIIHDVDEYGDLKSPIAAGYLMGDHKAAAKLKDDFQRIALIEGLYKSYYGAPGEAHLHSFREGIKGIAHGTGAGLNAFGEQYAVDSEKLQSIGEFLKESSRPTPLPDVGGIEQFGRDVVGTAPQMLQTLGLGPAGVGLMSLQILGQSYDEYGETTNLNEGQRFNYALANAFVSGILERVSLGSWKGLMTRNPGIRNAITKGVNTMLTEGGTEWGQEWSGEVAQLFAEAKSYDEDPINYVFKNLDFEKVMDQANYSGLIGIAMGSAGAVGVVAQESRKVELRRYDKEFYLKLRDKVREMKAKQENKEDVADVINAVADSVPDSPNTVYVPGDVLETYYQEHGEEWLDTLPINVADELRDAMKTKRDAELTKGDYLAHMDETGLDQAVGEDGLGFRTEDHNAGGSEKDNQELIDSLVDDIAGIQEQLAENAREETAAKVELDRIQAQLDTASSEAPNMRMGGKDLKSTMMVLHAMAKNLSAGGGESVSAILSKIEITSDGRQILMPKIYTDTLDAQREAAQEEAEQKPKTVVEKATEAVEKTVKKVKHAVNSVVNPEANRKTEITIPGQESMAAEYDVVELSDITASHDFQTFNPSKNYPAGVQERNYHADQNLQAEVSQTLEPDQVINDSPLATSGAPIVGPDGIVYGGNGRSMRIGRHYAAEGAEYKARLMEKADQFGMDAAAIEGMSQPVLVRRLAETPADAGKLSVALNVDSTLGKNAASEAVSRGRNVGDTTLSIFERIGEDETVRAFLDRMAVDLVAALQEDGVIAPAELSKFYDSRIGKFTDEGKTLIERAIIGRLLPDTNLIDAAPPRTRSKIVSVGAQLARLSANPEWDLSNVLRDAVIHIIAKGANTWDDYGGQQTMFAGQFDLPRSGAAYELAKWLDGTKAKQVREGLAGMARKMPTGSKNQSSMFPEAMYTPAEAFGAMVGVEDVTFFQSAPATDSDAFRAWFGDTGRPGSESVVTDAEGEPLVVHHGTSAKFDAFSTEAIGEHGTSEGFGFYFTDAKSVADGYAGNDGHRLDVYLNIRKPLSSTDLKITESELSDFIRAIDPDGVGYLSNWGDVGFEGYESVLAEAVANEMSGSDNDVDLISGIVTAEGGAIARTYEVLRDTLGYDGIVDQSPEWGGEQTVYVAFFPEQVKSVDNRGTFDGGNPNIYHQLAGTRSQGQSTEVRQNLFQAEQLEKQGVNREEIWKQTGWMKGQDGKWRYEISDQGAQLIGTLTGLLGQKYLTEDDAKKNTLVRLGKAKVVKRNGGGWGVQQEKSADDTEAHDTLDGILHHPALFAAYPQLKNIDVKVRVKKGLREWAVYRRGTEGDAYHVGRDPEISVLAPDMETALNVLLHEIQHGIQDIEGFAKGGSPELAGTMRFEARKKWGFWSDVYNLRREYERLKAEGHHAPWGQAMEDYREVFGEDSLNPEILMTARDYDLDVLKHRNDSSYEKLMKFGDGNKGDFGTYQNIQGEVEARDSASRQGMSTQERRASMPEYREDAIIVYDGDEYSLQQEPTMDQAKRGSVTLTDTQAIINLGKASDRSTFLHEAAHVYLEEARRMIESTDTDVSESFYQDYMKIMKWLGASSGQVTREQHEQFARGFEAYLMEGKSPSVGMADAFRRFKGWMTNIYQALTGLNVELNDEIRGVFDRVLASEAEINQAEEFYGGVAAYHEMYEADEAEKARLAAKRKKAQQTALDRHAQRLLAEWKRVEGGIKGIRKTAREQVEKEPVYAAIKMAIEKGGIPMGQVELLAGKLVAADLKKHGGSLVKKTGTASLLEVAIINGFQTEIALIEALSSSPKLKDAVEARKGEMIDQKLNDMREQAANAESIPGEGAYHSDARLDYLIAELNLLRKKLGSEEKSSKARLSVKIAREAARGIIGKKTGKQAKSYRSYSRAEAKYAKQAQAALKKGDMEAAEQAIRRQILHHALVLESVEADKMIQKVGSKYGKKKMAKKLQGVENEYLLAINQLLTRYGFALSKPTRRKDETDEAYQKRIDITKSADQNAQEGLAENGLTIPNVESDKAAPDVGSLKPSLEAITPEWLQQLRRPEPFRDFTDMTIDEIRELDEVLASYLKLGRDELTALRSEFGENVEELLAAIAENLEDRANVERQSKQTWTGRMQAWLAGKGARLQMMQYLADKIDNYVERKTGKPGPMGMIFRRGSELETKYEDRLQEKWTNLAAPLEVLAAAKKRIEDDHGKLFPIPGVEIPDSLKQRRYLKKWDVDMLIAYCLNLGTESNRFSLEAGFGGVDSNAVARMLRTEEWQAIQKIWDEINTLFPDLNKTHYRLTNRHMVKEEAQEVTFQTADHSTITLAGGYYPLRYDHAVDGKIGEFKEIEELFDKRNGVFMYAKAPKDGFKNARLKDDDGNPVVKRPVLLDVSSVLTSHLADTVRFITHGEYVKELDALTSHNNFQSMFTDKFGAEMYDALRKWVNYQARPERRMHGNFDKEFNKLRSMSTTAILGLRAKTGLKQRLSLFNAIAELDINGKGSGKNGGGLRWLMRGYSTVGLKAGVYGGTTERVAEINKLSSYMRQRAVNFDREARDYLRGLKPFAKQITIMGKSFSRSDADEVVWAMIKANDLATVYPIWEGAYQKAMELGLNGVADAETLEAKEMLAAQYADGTIQKSQPSSMPIDLAEIQRDEGYMRLFTSFMTFTMRAGNRLGDQYSAWREGAMDNKDFARHIILEWCLPVWTMNALAQLAYDDDDEPKWYDWIIGPAEYMTATLPILRDIPAGFRYGFKDAFFRTPAAKIPSEAGMAISNTIGGVADGDGDRALRGLYGMAKTFGYITGMPVTNLIDDGMREWKKATGK